MSSDKIWRGGMIGAGAWSNVQLDAWAGVENAEIVALTDRHPERRTPVVEKYGIPLAFNDFEHMLEEADLDFVDICTRPYSHSALSKLAADRGHSSAVPETLLPDAKGSPRSDCLLPECWRTPDGQ